MAGHNRSDEARELLARAPMFAKLEARSLKKLQRLCIPRSYPAGSIIIDEGATALGLFLITSGRVEVYKGSGADKVVLDVVGRGTVLGELALIDERPRSATVIAISDTECLLITRSGFQNLVRRQPDVAWCFVPVLAERMRYLQQRFIEAEAGRERPAADTPDSPESEPDGDAGEEPDQSSTTAEVVHTQHALARAGLTAASGTLEVARSFLDTLVDETSPDRDENVTEVAKRLPSGLFKAGLAALEEAEKIPERVLQTLRFHLRRE